MSTVYEKSIYCMICIRNNMLNGNKTPVCQRYAISGLEGPSGKMAMVCEAIPPNSKISMVRRV